MEKRSESFDFASPAKKKKNDEDDEVDEAHPGPSNIGIVLNKPANNKNLQFDEVILLVTGLVLFLFAVGVMVTVTVTVTVVVVFMVIVVTLIA
eukprot:Pgem_evm1s9966